MNEKSSCISEEMLCEYVDGTLSKEAEQALETHLCQCETCRTAEQEIRAGRDAACCAVPAFASGLHQRLEGIPATEHMRRRRIYRTVTTLAACFALAVGLLAGSFLFRGISLQAQNSESSGGIALNDAPSAEHDMDAEYQPSRPEEVGESSEEMRITCQGITASALARRLSDAGGPEPAEQTDRVLYFEAEQLDALTAFLNRNAIVWYTADSDETHGMRIAVYFE